MASSTDTAPAQAPATPLDCLKYIIDTASTDDETEHIITVIRTMIINVTKTTTITATCAMDAVRYVKSIIASQDCMLNRLRSRVQELPAFSGGRTNADVQAYRTKMLGEGWDDKKPIQTPLEEGEPFMRANQLVTLIEQKIDRESEIAILQAEVEMRLSAAVDSGWIPKGLRVIKDEPVA